MRKGSWNVGAKNPKAKYSVEFIKQVRAAYKGESKSDLARKLSMPRRTLVQILNRETWKEI